MSDTEEFFLGDSEDSSEFFLGDIGEEFFLGAPSQNIEDENLIKEDKDYQELLSVYELLKIADHPPCKGDSTSLQEMFFGYFKENPEIFVAVGTDYFQTLTEDEFNLFEKRCSKLIGIAHKKWISSENQRKIEELTEALNTLKTIFRYPEKTKLYIGDVKRILTEHLYASLKQKLKDGILEVSEIQELYEIAVSIHLVTDSEKGRKAFFEWIKKNKERFSFIIESYEETFIRIISSKEKIDLLDTDTVRSNLFKEYKNLAEISSHVLVDSKLASESELFEEMCQILSDKNILFSNTELFMKDFFELEVQKKVEGYFSVPIPSEYFYYIKGTAVNIYQFTEDQWREICFIHNIRNINETTVAFIMGTFKESSYSGIAKLLEDNPDMAASRILAGDLETYLDHIGGIGKLLAEKVSELKKAYKTNKQELVTGVVGLLKQEIGNIDTTETIKTVEKDTIDKLISKEADIKQLVQFVLSNKADEVLIHEITSDSYTSERIKTLLISKKKKYSYTKFLINILNELILEADITQYKNAFIKIAKKIQDNLLKNDDFITYLFVFTELLIQAEQKEILKLDIDFSDYKENFELMNTKFNECKNTLSKDNKKKSKFGFFKKAE